jgi:hypothetical protein
VTSTDSRLDIFARAEHVLLMLAYTTSATLFAIALWLGVGWLTDIGQGVAAGLLVGVYVILSLPILVVQLGVVGDLFFVFVQQDPVAVPALRAISEGVSVGWPLRVLAGILTAVCPFSSLSTWVWSIALPTSRAADLARAKHRTEAAVTAAAWRRLKTLV